MPLQWTKDLSVNVKEIDAQHQSFVALVNDLYKAFDEIKLQVTLGDILNQLDSYARFHFATEEKYFDLFDYEGSEEHKKIHREMLADVENFKKRFATEGIDIVEELMDFMENWVVNHLQIYDKKYTKCFNEHGLY